MLTADTAPARHEVMARHQAVLTARIARAQATLRMLDGALTCEHDDL